jgi:hypothetical protein
MGNRTITSECRKNAGAEKGPLPYFTWRGGYPMYYLDHDNSPICPKCANTKKWSDKKIIDADINYEEADLYCENCNARIPPAYRFGEGYHYDASTDRFGNITLTRAEDKASVYFQGDDAEFFRADWEAIQKIWNRTYSNQHGGPYYRKHFGPFKDYSEHFDSIASDYDSVMGKEE